MLLFLAYEIASSGIFGISISSYSDNRRRQSVKKALLYPLSYCSMIVEQPGLEPGTHVVPSAFAT